MPATEHTPTEGCPWPEAYAVYVQLFTPQGMAAPDLPSGYPEWSAWADALLAHYGQAAGLTPEVIALAQRYADDEAPWGHAEDQRPWQLGTYYLPTAEAAREAATALDRVLPAATSEDQLDPHHYPNQHNAMVYGPWLPTEGAYFGGHPAPVQHRHR